MGGDIKRVMEEAKEPPPPLLSRWERGNYIPLPLFRAKEALELVCRERRSAQRRRGGALLFWERKTLMPLLLLLLRTRRTIGIP